MRRRLFINLRAVRSESLTAAAVTIAALAACTAAATAAPGALVSAVPISQTGARPVRAVAAASVLALGAALLAGVLATDFFGAVHLAVLIGVCAAGAAATWRASALARHTPDADRAAFLGETATLLLASPGRDAAIRTAARLAVPTLADWCVLDVLETDGAIGRRMVLDADEGRVEEAWTLRAGYAVATHGPARVLRTGIAQLFATIPGELVDALARDEASRTALGSIASGSALVVPLSTVRGRIGVMTLGTRAPRRLTESDVELFEDVASRYALAIGGARGPVEPAFAPPRFTREAPPPTSPAGA